MKGKHKKPDTSVGQFRDGNIPSAPNRVNICNIPIIMLLTLCNLVTEQVPGIGNETDEHQCS